MKGYNKIKEFIEEELSDYSYFETGELKLQEEYDDYEYYNIDIKKGDKEKTICFRYDLKEDIIEVELGEDSYHETRTYDYQIKYFWQAVLDW